MECENKDIIKKLIVFKSSERETYWERMISAKYIMENVIKEKDIDECARVIWAAANLSLIVNGLLYNLWRNYFLAEGKRLGTFARMVGW